MKKSTILILLIVFVLSVVVVGFFGMKIMSYNVKVYIKEIVPTQVVIDDDNGTTYTYYPNGSDSKYQIRNVSTEAQPNTYAVMVPYYEGLTLIADYVVIPNDATNRDLKITITYDSAVGNLGDGVYESESAILNKNRITFKQAADITVTFRSTDGSNVRMRLKIYLV